METEASPYSRASAFSLRLHVATAGYGKFRAAVGHDIISPSFDGKLRNGILRKRRRPSDLASVAIGEIAISGVDRSTVK
jgi:hypothetical protein